MDDGSKHKKAKGTKKCVIKQKIMSENHKDCLFNEKNILKKQQRFNTEEINMYTEEINKVASSSNDNKRLQTFDRVAKFPQETLAVKVCENEF